MIDGSLLFSDIGEVVDLESKRKLGSFDLETYRSEFVECYENYTKIEPDVTASRVYYLCNKGVMAFDPKSLAALGEIRVPDSILTSPESVRPNFVRVGADHIAVAIEPNIYLIRTDAIR